MISEKLKIPFSRLDLYAYHAKIWLGIIFFCDQTEKLLVVEEGNGMFFKLGGNCGALGAL